MLAENSADLPKDIVAQFKINRELSAALNQQAQRMDLVPRNSVRPPARRYRSGRR
ncbi:hypothetical protein ACVXHB_00225 [Escherichia coli]